MKERLGLKVVYILSVFSIFTPWFTYDASMMGYCWGFSFLKWFILPMSILAIYLFQPEHSKLFTVLSEISMLINFMILVLAFGRWQETCNINTGFHWKDGLVTAMPTYWISLWLFISFFILFQYVLFKKHREKT